MTIYRERRSRMKTARRGVAVVESAITLSVTLMLLLALLDLGVATLQYNSLGHACRLVARAVVLRGVESPTSLAAMGPITVVGNANDGSEAAQLVASLLPTMSPNLVTFSIQWLDGDNSPGDRVHVEMNYLHRAFVPGLSSWGSVPIHASSTMRVVN